MLIGVEDIYNRIKTVSLKNDFDLDFWGLEYARSWQTPYGSAFMEDNGALYQSIVQNVEHHAAIDFALQYIRDPLALKDHRIHPFTYLPPPML